MNVPPKLTKEEKCRLEKYISMADWHFEILFLEKCTRVSSHIIRWEMAQKNEPKYARVYGINAVPVATQKPVLVNFFIRYEIRVYGVPDIVKASEIIKLLKKEAAYNHFELKVKQLKIRQKEKAVAAKQRSKIKTSKAK